MNSSQFRRLWVVIGGFCLATLIVIGRLIAFQIIQSGNWAERASDEIQVIAKPERGTIYDRNGAVLAANGADYQISVAPNLVTEPDELATAPHFYSAKTTLRDIKCLRI